MTKKRRTRRALLNSIMSLILCFAMLLGTTFAWFTDSVVTGMNTIAAGNLDIELLANGNEVDSNTKLFDDVTLWEPGAVVYENLQVANVGTLALKYQMTLNFGKENNLNGHKLSEVLKVAVLDAPIDASTMTREQVLAKAKTALAADQGNGSLSNFYLTGELEAGTKSAGIPVVIFWEPNDNDVDNLYNANNGQKTSDNEPLHIEFGVNLQATQLMHEKDSFGPDYDEFATILPKATVVDLGATTIKATTNDWGSDLEANEYKLNAAFQFLPNETAEEVESSAYKYWHADYVVTADRDVAPNAIALAGYYTAFCEDYNNDNWVALESDQAIAANTPIRLVSTMLGGGSVNYEEICSFGNDGVGFKCGIAGLDDSVAGTTVTVELRMYETTKDPNATSGPANIETGKSVVVGTYKYTFPVVKAADADELKAALENGAGEVALSAGTYTFPTSSFKEGTILTCEEGTVFEGLSKLNIDGATVVGATFSNPGGTAADQTINGTFKDCTFTGTNGLRWCYAGETVVFENCVFDGSTYGVHFDGGANEVVFKNCTISGFNTMGGAVTKLTMEGCTFKANGKSNYNGINLWGNTDLKDCTFVFDGTAGNEWVDLCSSNQTVTFTNCVVTDGTNTTPIKDVVGNYGDGNTIIIDGVTENIPNMS